MKTKKSISFHLNNEERNVEVFPNETLLDVLRTKLGVTSPKCGCNKGDCGSCTVLIDNKSVKSCLVLAIEVEGHEVTTLEGLMKNGLTDLQKSLLNNNSFQCGFCAPGMIISTHELRENVENPSEEEIKEALAGNLCRCTGYTPIIDAIKQLNTNQEKS